MRGANVIYYSVIRPNFLKHEAKIDDIVTKGTRGVEQIKDTVVKTGKVGKKLTFLLVRGRLHYATKP